MGHIKEPVGVDFEINSRELTKEEESAISEFIKSYKAKLTKGHHPKRKTHKRVSPKKSVALHEK